MAIINITPDSFYSESRTPDKDTYLQAVERALSEGADLLDIGGYSSRPGADFVSEQEEIDRIGESIRHIRHYFSEVPISVDTFRGAVAQMAVQECGADIINDISAGILDHTMLPIVAQLNVPYIMMHMRGTPQTMQKMINYDDLVAEILIYFSEKIATLRALGFTSDVIIDPGFGFAKSTEQNYELLRKMRIFEAFDAPLLVGISRKSMIYKPLNITPQEALNGTTVLNTIALMQGANILRVHDVKAAVEAVRLTQFYRGS